MWNTIHLFFDYFSGCEIITDPNLIRQIETESAFKSKFRSIKSVPFSEPWFTKKSKLQVEQLLYNSFHVDGYFLVNPDYSKENNSVVALYLSVMCSDVLHQFKIVQVKSDARYFIVNIFCPCDYYGFFCKIPILFCKFIMPKALKWDMLCLCISTFHWDIHKNAWK